MFGTGFAGCVGELVTFIEDLLWSGSRVSGGGGIRIRVAIGLGSQDNAWLELSVWFVLSQKLKQKS